MRAVLQRVTNASVTVGESLVGEIGQGLLALISVETDDSIQDARFMADKIVSLRIFRDEQDKMNLSVSDIGGAVLVVSQFTLHGDCRRGRRPSFVSAARPETAIPLYQEVVRLLKDEKGLAVATGEFGAYMQVALTNDGPVTLLVDSRKQF